MWCRFEPSVLRELRQSLGLNQTQVAAQAGCCRPMITMIENGRRKPSRRLLRRVLGALARVALERKVVDLKWWGRMREIAVLCRVRWTRVKNIERVEYSHPFVYDLSVPGPETFYAGHGGLFVHNTFTIANVIQQVQRPTLVLAHNKTLAAQLYGEFKEFFPENSVEYFVSLLRLLPARGLRALERHLYREGRLDQRAHRADAPVGHQGAARAPRRDHRRDGVGHLRPGRSRDVPRDDPASEPRRAHGPAHACCVGSPTCSTRATSWTCRRGTYRVRGDVIDVFPAESAREAVRIELFDETIESLAVFDPLTGEVQRKLPRYTIYPGSHYVTPQGAPDRRHRSHPRRAARAARRCCATRTSWSKRSGSSSAPCSTWR